MGGIGDKFTVLAQVVCDLVKKSIDLTGQLVEFISDPAQSESFFQMTGTKSLGGPDQSLQRFDGAFGQQQSTEGCNQQNSNGVIGCDGVIGYDGFNR